MNDISIDSLLAQMRALSDAAGARPVGTASAGEPAVAADGPEFSRLLKDSLDQVNALQSNARELKASFETGDNEVSLPEVMVAVQKASVSFEAVTQVRNRLLSAYQDVMNMQV